jgi:hypothetical protein
MAIDKPEEGTSKSDFQLQLRAPNKQLTGSATGSFVKDNYCELRNLQIDGRTLYFEVDSRIENLQMKVFLNLKDGKLKGEGIPINAVEDRCDIVLTKIKRPRTSDAPSDDEAIRLLQTAASGRGQVSVIPTSTVNKEAEAKIYTISEMSSSKSKPVPLAQDDGKSAGKKSIAGSGHAVFFENAQKSELVAVMIYGSRYGHDRAPNEKFHIWLCDMDQQVIEDFQFPYGTFKKGDPKWVRMRVKSTELPERFYLCAGFNPEQTKGVYVHYDGSASGNSYKGLPKDGFTEFDTGDWMIRAVVRPLAGKPAASEGGGGELPSLYSIDIDESLDAGQQVNSSNLQSVIDEANSGAVIQIPAGTYEQPIRINKPLILRGTSQDKCVFKVTANEPAIMVDTKGKGKVLIENMTIQWQLATSDKHEFPFAVAVKDTTATIHNCTFRPLGNPQRSPVAIRAMGFSNMVIAACDFTGFDYVVCYGEGTKGKIHDSFIRNCGHQGVILYSGAQAEISRNIITGSKYHAVRTTGGKLTMRGNLIINNKNRGVYLGNKSGSGSIENNLIIGNGTGIDGISACRFRVRNNIILKSEYAAISAIPQARLQIQNNVLADNQRGISIQQEEGKSDPIKSKFGKNVFWKNQTDTENCECPDMIELEPDFIEPGNGNFTLADPAFEGMGLSDPKVIFDLWQKYKEKQ